MSDIITDLFGEDALKSKHTPIYIDRTDLQAFADCPQQGQLRKQHEGEIETTELLPVACGIVHDIAKESIQFADGNLREAADYFAEELPKALGRTDLQPDIIRGGKNLANELTRFGANRVLLCEEQISRTVLPETETHGEIIVTTKPDLVLATQKADTILALDYKAGYKSRTSQETKDDFQTCVISWCLKAKYPEIKTIHFFYIETRIFKRSYARIDFEEIVGSHDLTQEQAFQQRILGAVNNYITGNDEAWPSSYKCGICPVVKLCKLVDIDIKEIIADPKIYLDSYIVKQAACDNMLKAMKDYVKDGKVIYGSEERFSFEPNPRFAPKLHKNNDEKDEE